MWAVRRPCAAPNRYAERRPLRWWHVHRTLATGVPAMTQSRTRPLRHRGTAGAAALLTVAAFSLAACQSDQDPAASGTGGTGGAAGSTGGEAPVAALRLASSVRTGATAVP